LNPLKRYIVDDHTKQVGRHDSPALFSGPAGDPGLTGPGSVSWRVNSDVSAIAIGGVSAIIMEILHPSVMAGVQDQSNYAEDPYRRARTTYGYVVTTTFGNTKSATRLINAVKGMHKRVNGTRPDGVPYRALDPKLIAWVHTCIPWAVMTAYERFNRPLTSAERDSYLTEQAVIGRMTGADQVPETVAELEEYVESMRPVLEVTDQTRQFFEFLLSSPFGVRAPEVVARRGNRFQLASGMSLMPAWARELSGFGNHPVVQRAIADPSLHAYARTLRWAFATPPFRRLAEERARGHGSGQTDERTAARGGANVQTSGAAA
jgi:uncharacterized protein (DUF2236 family)